MKDFIVAIELGSSKVTGIAGQKNLDGSVNVLAVVKEPSSSFIRKGVVYNIDKTAQCLQNIVKKLETQLKQQIVRVYVGVGGQSIRGVRNVVTRDLPAGTIVTEAMVDELVDANRTMDYADQEILDTAIQEYKVDSQYQQDPVGIQCTHLEGNYLNILQRKAFYKNFNKCFEISILHLLHSANQFIYAAHKTGGKIAHKKIQKKNCDCKSEQNSYLNEKQFLLNFFRRTGMHKNEV